MVFSLRKGGFFALVFGHALFAASNEPHRLASSIYCEDHGFQGQQKNILVSKPTAGVVHIRINAALYEFCGVFKDFYPNQLDIDFKAEWCDFSGDLGAIFSCSIPKPASASEKIVTVVGSMTKNPEKGEPDTEHRIELLEFSKFSILLRRIHVDTGENGYFTRELELKSKINKEGSEEFSDKRRYYSDNCVVHL